MTTYRKTLRKNSTVSKREQIFDLIKHGFSYSRVGEMMGMSKSGVAGFVFREKRKKPKRLDLNKPRATRIKNKINLDMPKVNQGITIFELRESTCRYMIGDHKYCGDTVTLQSYCEAHAKACYVTPKKRWR